MRWTTRLLCLLPSPPAGAHRALLLLAATCLLAFGARAQAPAPANDDPCGAVPLTLNGSLCTTPTVGTNAGATTTSVLGTVNNTCGAFNNTSPKDVWYTFTTAATGDASAGATITVTGNPAGVLRLFSAPSCTGTFTQISCTSSNAANTAAPRLVTGALQPGTTYYLQVAGYTSNDVQGQFTICVTDPPACGAPAIIGVTFPTSTSAEVAFTPGPGNTTFTVQLTGGGNNQTLSNATSPVTFAGLTPGTTYFVSVRSDCGGGVVQSPFFSFTVPLLNDDPCGAIALPISSACSPTTGTNFGAGTTVPNGYTNPGCALDPSPMDVWYQFTTPATGGASTSATISVTGFAAGQVRLFSAASCSGPLTQLACSQSPTGPALPLSYTSLQPSTTYYVMVAGYSDSSPRGQFTICVTGAPACPDPTNITLTSTSTTSATLAFTPSPNATSYNVTYALAGGGTPVTVTPAPTTSPVALSNLTAGGTYTVTLQSVCPAGLGSQITRTFTVSSAPPPNDEPCGATPIASVGIGTCGAALTGTVTAATATASVGNPGCAGYQGGDVWYSIVVPANGTLQVETGRVNGSNLTDTGLALYSGSCTGLTLLECDDDDSPDGNFSLIRRSGLTPGSTVYARVWRFGNPAPGGDFTICAQTDALCPTVANLGVSSITSTSATLTFTGATGAGSYTITYTPQGGTLAVLSPNPTASPAVIGGLSPNTTYTATIQANCPAGQGLPLALTFTTAPPAPANDNCSGATALTVSTTCTGVTSSTLGATPSAAPVPAVSCATGTVNDVWFSLTVPANGVVQVNTASVSGSPVVDTGLELYSGSCGALTSIGCNDNFGGSNFSQVRASGLTPGSTVYARVWQLGGGTGGQFSVCATTDPPCPAVTSLAVGSITTTTASVSFVPPTNGTSYTLTYTPQGGTATTVTPAPTASPVALSGLTPGTQYTVSVVSNCGGGLTSTAATTTFTTTSCIAPVNLSVSGITTTAASVSFGAGNGSSYTVTYTPQGGTATTVTPNPTASPVALSGLTPGTQYTVSIVSNCGPGQTSSAATTTFSTLAPPCNPVTNLAATAITTTSATLTFTPASTGTSYTVTYTPAGGTATTVTPAPTGSPVALSGLAPGTQYTVRVVSNCGGQASTAASITFSTLSPCLAVTNLAAGSITTTTASLSFTPASTGSSYTVTYTPAGGTATTVTPAPTTSPVALSGLTPGTTYTVSVVSNCGSGQTSAAATTTFTTAALPVCAAVTGLTAGTVTSTSAVLTFTPATNGTSYTVTYTPQGGTATTVTPAPTASPVSLLGLTPGTQYSVSVVSNCGGGQTSAAATTTFTTTAASPCPPATSLAVGSITASSASVSFVPGAGNTSYQVSYLAAGGSLPVIVSPNPTNSPVALTGLQPNTQYTVCVTSICGSQSATAPVCLAFTTAAASCAPPTGVAIGSVTTTSATVTFVPSASASGYTVTYTPAGGTAQTATATGSPVVLTGLMPNTSYALSMVSNCAGGSVSAPTASLAFTTQVTATPNAALAQLVRLHPNPARHTFRVEVPAALSRQAIGATLYNSVGQQVLRRTLPAAPGGHSAAFDVSQLPRGVYSLHLATAEGVLVKRVLVE